MKETSTGQEILQVLAIIFLTILICCAGEYGKELIDNRQTSFGWRMWGAFLFLFIFVLPTAAFWSKQLRKLFNLED